MVVSAAGQSKPRDNSAARGAEGDDTCLGVLPGKDKANSLLYLAAQKGRHVHIP